MKKVAVLILFVVPILFGCESKKLKQENADLKTQVEKLTEDKVSAESHAGELSAKVDELTLANKDLNSKVEKLSKENKELTEKLAKSSKASTAKKSTAATKSTTSKTTKKKR